jgi:hypothetical protein
VPVCWQMRDLQLTSKDRRRLYSAVGLDRDAGDDDGGGRTSAVRGGAGVAQDTTLPVETKVRRLALTDISNTQQASSQVTTDTEKMHVVTCHPTDSALEWARRWASKAPVPSPIKLLRPAGTS